MAKLSARGRACLESYTKTKEYSPPYHDGEYNEDFSITLKKSNEYEWTLKKYRIMSDGHLLFWEKWKHHKHTEPFISGWKDKGKIKDIALLRNDLVKYGFVKEEV